MYDICIGRLPMYSGEPFGLWIGEDGKTAQFRGCFAPKTYRRTLVVKLIRLSKWIDRPVDSTIPDLVLSEIEEWPSQKP